MKCSDCKFTDPDYNVVGDISEVYALCTLNLPPWVRVHESKDGTHSVQIHEYSTDGCDLGVKKEQPNG